MGGFYYCLRCLWVLLVGTHHQYAYAGAGGNCKYVTIPVCDEDQSMPRILSKAGVGLPSKGEPGSPGKRGPVGPPGEKGDKGQKGLSGNDGRSITLDEVEEIVQAKVQEKLNEVVQMTGADFCKTAVMGVYSVYGEQYLCDGQGWTIFQNRNDSVNFERTWMEYREGFGSMHGSFWLGLDKLYKLVHGRDCGLRIDLKTFSNTRAYAQYSSFSIGAEGDNYRLRVSGFSGDAGDSLSGHNTMKFSTKDRDNDAHPDAKYNCARGHGGWWYNACFSASLNAPWGRSSGNWQNMIWYAYKGSQEAMQEASMKIKCE